MKSASGSSLSIMCSIKPVHLKKTSLNRYSNKLGIKGITKNVMHCHLAHRLKNKITQQESPLKPQFFSLSEIQIPSLAVQTNSQSLWNRKPFLSTERKENRTTLTEVISLIAMRTKMKMSWMIVRAYRRSQGSPQTPQWAADMSLKVTGISTEHSP